MNIIRKALADDTRYYNKLVAMAMGHIGPLAFVKEKVCIIGYNIPILKPMADRCTIVQIKHISNVCLLTVFS